ncbi:acyl-CoA dehydrogenase family protein [Streptomyces sp. L7]
MTSAVGLVGEGCTSAAWAASLAAYAGRYGAFLPEEGQADIWADGPDALLAGALMPSGKAEPVAGGWRLSGEWKYISGVHFADWALACAAVPTEGPVDPDARPEVRFFDVPRADFAIEDSWFTVGMRGTGSDTLLLTDAFVPDHRTLARSAVHAGRAPASDARCHLVPMYAVNALPFAAPLVGAARGALRAWIARTGARVDRRGQAVGEKPSTQVALARSAAEVDAAELLILRTAAVADGTEHVPDGEAAVRGARDLAPRGGAAGLGGRPGLPRRRHLRPVLLRPGAALLAGREQRRLPCRALLRDDRRGLRRLGAGRWGRGGGRALSRSRLPVGSGDRIGRSGAG